MWKQRILNRSETYGRAFNNSKVFETITSNNRESPTRPIIYKPIRQYCQDRFVRHIEIIGTDQVVEIFSKDLPGTRLNITFSNETRVLAFLVGLRETGLPLVLHNRKPKKSSHYFVNSRNRYIRNFDGSGLDYLGRESLRRRVSRFLGQGLRRQIFKADPLSNNPFDIGIRQRNIHAVFAAYFRHQANFYLSVELSSINSRLIRYFWRALTFGGQGGSDWPRSKKGGRNSLIILFRLLNLSPQRVPDLWNTNFVNRRISTITDIGLLRKIAREENSFRKRDDIQYWQNRAKIEIRNGLGTARYFQAMKLAAIAEAFSEVLRDNFYQ